jgi:hypothetical protein
MDLVRCRLRAGINLDTHFRAPSSGLVQADHILVHRDIFGPHDARYVVSCPCRIDAIAELTFFQLIFLGCSSMDYRPSAHRRNAFRNICVEFKNRLSDAFLRSQPMEMDLADHRRVCSGSCADSRVPHFLSVLVWSNIDSFRWNNLLTPQTFQFNSHIDGRELDLSSSLITPLLSSGALDDCVFNTSTPYAHI